MAADDSQTIKFVADKMLGRLVRWLRIIGQDVAHGPHLSGHGLVREARREGRLILTRDRILVKKKNIPEHLLLRSDNFREQLKQVIEACGLDPVRRLFTRCAVCNSLLEPIAKESVKEKIPPYVFSTQEKFSTCRKCQRIYWPATHQERMIEELKSLGITSPGK